MLKRIIGEPSELPLLEVLKFGEYIFHFYLMSHAKKTHITYKNQFFYKNNSSKSLFGHEDTFLKLSSKVSKTLDSSI